MADFRLPLSGISTHKSVNPSLLTLNTAQATAQTYDGSSPVTVNLYELSVASADKWTNSCSITIGDQQYAIDGTSAVVWTLADIGAVPAVGGKVTGRIYREGASTAFNKGRDNALVATSTLNGYSPFASIKTKNGSWQIGASTDTDFIDDLIFTYITDTYYNNANSGSPVHIKFLENGHIATDLDGNASTASSAAKWTSAITLTIGNTGHTVDGSQAVAWTISEIGAAPASHSHGNISNNGKKSDTTVAPADAVTSSHKFLREDGSWVVPNYLTIGTSAGSALDGSTDVNNVNIGADVTTNSNYPVVFAKSTTSTTGSVNEKLNKNSTKFYFNPSTGKVTATEFAGKFSGNVTGNVTGDVTGNADTATKFASSQSIALTGDITGSASSQAGWSITTTIGEGKVTNTMLAGSIANAKLSNSSMTFGSQTISLGSSINLATLLTDLGITRAFQYLGTTSTVPTGSTFNGLTCVSGDMVLCTAAAPNDGMYAYNGTTWDKIATTAGAYKIIQTATSASGSTLKTLTAISQNENGDVSVTFSDIQTATNAQLGVVQLVDTYNSTDGNNATTCKAIASAFTTLSGNLNSTTPGSGKTLTALSQTNGILSATFGNISITKSQVSDFSHTHGNLSNDGKITTAITIANNDYIIIGDSSESGVIGKGPVFDGSTKTKCLTQAGTWETFNNYTIPVATYNSLGGVKPWYSHTEDSIGPTAGSNATAIAVNALTSVEGKYYAVESDKSGRLFVNVPWNGGDTSGLVIRAGDTMTGLLKTKGLKGTTDIDYGDILPNDGAEGRIFFQISDGGFELPAGGATGQALIKSSSADRDVEWGAAGSILRPDASTKYYVGGSSLTTENTNPILFNTAIYVQNSVLQGAAWNDYAEYRETKETIEAGRCVVEVGDDTLELSTSRRQPGAEIVSDTFGFAIGQTEKCNTPIAVTGRVLAFPYEDISRFTPGRPVCSGPQGTVSVMSDEEARSYPWCIIGTVSGIPQEEYWGANKVSTKGRVWIRVK